MIAAGFETTSQEERFDSITEELLLLLVLPLLDAFTSIPEKSFEFSVEVVSLFNSVSTPLEGKLQLVELLSTIWASCNPTSISVTLKVLASVVSLLFKQFKLKLAL